MEVWSWVAISLCLFAAAVGMMFAHLRTWRLIRDQGERIDREELDYRRRQFRRRMQTSAMLGIVAAALLVGRWIRYPQFSPIVLGVFWGLILFLVGWLTLLGALLAVSARRLRARRR